MSDDTYDMPEMYKRLLQRTTELQNERNLDKFLGDIVNEAPDLKEAVILIVNSEDKFGLAKAMLGFNIEYQYAESIFSSMARQTGKSMFPRFDFDSLPKITGEIRYISDDLVGPTGPAKAEPDWKHPIPVSVKSDGPSKQKRAKLRAKRKK